MCTRYISPEVGDIERHWHIGARHPLQWVRDVYPTYAAPFIRAAPDDADHRRELVVGQWALLPGFAKERKLRYPTCNARSEELAAKASYKTPWRRGQRCVIPALAFFEPNWESGRHVRWQFTRADDDPWGLAGLWNTWIDPVSGERVESFTMLTVNADRHPLMSRMHRPDPALPPDAQDKRSVVSIELADVDTWLSAPLAMAAGLLRPADVQLFSAGPETVAGQLQLL